MPKELSALDFASLATLLETAFYTPGMDRDSTAFLICSITTPPLKSQLPMVQGSSESFVYIDSVIAASVARGIGVAMQSATTLSFPPSSPQLA
jgi:predicted GNAT superfamily acetyltransferase